MERPSDDRIDGRRLRYQHRRPELLQAVTDYILTNGIADLSLRPMARDLGIAHATLLRHFGTKEALVVEVITQIRSDLVDTLSRRFSDIAAAPTDEVLRTIWQELRRPDQRRQFLLLFEVAAHDMRTPGRFGDLTSQLITTFLDPLERNLRLHGRSTREARDLATGFVALIRGLQIDLVISNDLARADAAMRRHIELIAPATQHHPTSPTPDS